MRGDPPTVVNRKLVEEMKERQRMDPVEADNLNLIRENARLREEIREARNEASVVRRAYLHERGRANAAVRALENVGALAEAGRLDEHKYRGPAEGYASLPSESKGSGT